MTKGVSEAKTDRSVKRSEGGYAINHQCSEIGYILKGAGKLITETGEAHLSAGDVVYIPQGERYYWEGNITVILPATPPWHPQQHETGLPGNKTALLER